VFFPCVRYSWADYKAIFSNRYYALSLAGITANCFALGAFADWMATFLHRYRGMTLEGAGLVIGAATVVSLSPVTRSDLSPCTGVCTWWFSSLSLGMRSISIRLVVFVLFVM
jgi:hypothetical protein